MEKSIKKFSKKELAWIKERSWYKDNSLVGACLNASRNASLTPRSEGLPLRKELLGLYKEDPEQYADKIEILEKEIADDELNCDKKDKEILIIRKKLNIFLELQDRRKRIQEII